MTTHFEVGNEVKGANKRNRDRLGKVTKVTLQGNRHLYTVKWNNGEVEEDIAKRGLVKPGEASKRVKGTAKKGPPSRKRGRPPKSHVEEDSSSNDSESSASSSSQSSSNRSSSESDEDR